jgi:hypothetical protein
MKCSNNSGVMYLAIGVAFMSLGMTNAAFLGVGVAFLGLGASLMVRSKGCSIKKLK